MAVRVTVSGMVEIKSTDNSLTITRRIGEKVGELAKGLTGTSHSTVLAKPDLVVVTVLGYKE